MARSAGLLGRPNWQRYPRAMLLARATGDLARILFADVVKGLGYVAEDESALVPELGLPVEPEQPETARRKPLQRATRARGPRPVESADLPAPTPQIADSERPPVAPAITGEAVDNRPALAPEPDEPPPSSKPPGWMPGDQPLPDEMAPVGTGRPLRPLPDLEPEQPDDETPGKTIGVRPLKALHAGLTRELGTEATRDERLMLLGAILGRPVETSKTLSRDEGYRVLAAFDQFSDGSASWEFTDGGLGMRVVDLREPPDDA